MKPSPTIPPTVNCVSIGGGGSGCSPIVDNGGGAKTNPTGINAYANRQVNPFTVEPPDQALCVGAGYAVELLNQGEMQVFSSSTLQPVSSVASLDTVMGLSGLGWSSGGDPMCQYDSANGGHWFLTEFASTTTEASGGPFSGCFAGATDSCREAIAVSATNNPMGSYYVYFVDPNFVNSDPGSNANPDCSTGTCYASVLLNDYAKTATTKDAFLLFYDEFDLATGALNGVQEFAFSKYALENGLSTVNVAQEDFGTAPNLSPIPANGAFQPFALPGSAWYQVIPAQTTDPTQYDNSNGGTGFMVASLDFFGSGDNRTAVFDWTGLSNLNSAGCSGCSGIQFGGQLLSGQVTYQDEGGSCPVTDYYSFSLGFFCGLAPQKAGPTPLGDNCMTFEPNRGITSQPCPEGDIATNGDGATEAFYAAGTVWTAVSTVVVQNFNHAPSELHIGAAYWGVNVHDSSGPTITIGNQGYVSAAHEEMEFPSMAATSNAVLMSFTLSGNGGPTGADNGGYYPSSAYIMLFKGNTIRVADQGQSPQDGFTEYIFPGGLFTNYRPRWGDYGQAVFDPSTGKFFFSSEYIQSPNCSGAAFLSDTTCGGTRWVSANWGSSINSIGP